MIADLDRLKANLLTSGLQNKDSALYQVINQLIDATKQVQALVNANIAAVSAAIPPSSAAYSYLTENDDSANLPNARQLLAGVNITFDDTIVGQRTIDSIGGASSEWSVLTNGDAVNPELIFAGGDVIMLHTP